MMTRFVFLVYGIVAYVLFLGSFLYAAGFVENLVVAKTIDAAPQSTLWKALLIDATLLGIFALQHSIMARKSFKKWWTTIVPEPVERSTYVLFSSICLIAIIYFWQPVGGIVWSVESATLQYVFIILSLIGWGLVLLSTFLINHFDLFGLRQVWIYFVGENYKPVRFRTPAVYKYVRHPLYLGFIIAFWFTPVMTIAHLVFAVLTTGYIMVGIYFEEKDLISSFGDRYSSYKKLVPKLIPFTKRKKESKVKEEALRAA